MKLQILQHASSFALVHSVAFLGMTAISSRLQAASIEVTVSIENLAPFQGNHLTPFWVGFHDGTFATYTDGQPASPALERLAEDGSTAPLSAEFGASGKGSVDGTLSERLAPNARTSQTFTLDSSSPQSRYFSFASMVIPSNDAFVANAVPNAHQVFDANGQFVPQSFFIVGSHVRDAGTEVNDELPANTAFFGQSMPNTGMPEGGMVHLHTGFNAKGSGGILDSADFAYADFLKEGYPIAHVVVVPEPSSLALGGLGALLLVRGVLRHRRGN